MLKLIEQLPLLDISLKYFKKCNEIINLQKNIITCLTLIITSCSAGDSREITESSENAVSYVTSINETSRQRVAYSLLTAEERLYLWNEQLNDILEKEDLTKEQSELIISLQNELTVDIFADYDNDKKSNFKNIFVPTFLEDAQVIFSAGTIYRFFYVFTKSDGSSGGGGGGGDEKACDCNQGSMFGCGSTNDCADSSTCEDTSWGCGFMLGWGCNGLCNWSN